MKKQPAQDTEPFNVQAAFARAPQRKNCPQHALNLRPEPQMHGCFIGGSGTVGSMKYQRPSTRTNAESSSCRLSCPCSAKCATKATCAWFGFRLSVCRSTSKPSHSACRDHCAMPSLSSNACCAGTVVATS